MHFSRIRTAHSLTDIPWYPGGGGGGNPSMQTSPDADPLDADPTPTPDADPPGCRPPRRQTPPAPVDKRNDTRLCKHYLPATTVMGGKKKSYRVTCLIRRNIVFHHKHIPEQYQTLLSTSKPSM